VLCELAKVYVVNHGVGNDLEGRGAAHERVNVVRYDSGIFRVMGISLHHLLQWCQHECTSPAAHFHDLEWLVCLHRHEFGASACKAWRCQTLAESFPALAHEQYAF